jgi:hypothetical protein
MKLKIRSLLTLALATGLLLSPSHIRRADADDQHQKACSNKTLNGSFGTYRTGSTSTGPLAALGILFFDGNGNVSGSQNISRNGVFTFDNPISGPYEVAADCTARFLMDNGVEVARVVIVDGGKGFYEFSETAGNAVYGVGKKTTRTTTRTAFSRVTE